MIEVTSAKLAELEGVLLNSAGNVSLAQRFRALFTLKGIGASDERVINIIGKGTPAMGLHSPAILTFEQASGTRQPY